MADAVADTLKDMGFADNQIQTALKATGSKELETVLNWIMNNEDASNAAPPSANGESPGQPLGGAPNASDGATPANPTSVDGASARSLKCEDCGKLLSSEVHAEAHAVKTGHSNFAESTEEIKPLTQEEKEQKLNELKQRMEARRKEKEAVDKAEALERERMRRKEGQSLSQIKQDLEAREMKLIAEQRRKEKEEDRLARERVKAEIARDREEKKKKLANSDQSASPIQLQSNQPQTASVPSSTNYTQSRIQIRFKSGGAQPLVHAFSVSETLAAVRLYAQMNSQQPLDVNKFTFMTTFPKKVFTEEEMQMSLQMLGLVPSSVLVVCDK